MGEGLYIHVPFCRRRCAYCGLPSTQGRLDLVPAYLEALAVEARRRLPGRVFHTLFIGGGTPSVLGVDGLETLFATVVGEATLVPGAEASVEVNPESFSPGVAAVLRRCGVTRISLGAQAMDDEGLAALGRLHRRGDVDAAAKLILGEGFSSWSLDLIAGWPGQDVGRWRATLDAACALEPDHLSVYLWHREYGTAHDRALRAGRLAEVDDEAAASMYYEAKDVLEARGYEHYEISNFARPGHRCLHNLTYWRGGSYCGLGAGAASHEDGRRFTNLRSPERYVERVREGRVPSGRAEHLGHSRKWRESLVLALRLLEPVSLEGLCPSPGAATVSSARCALRGCVDEGLVDEDGTGFVLSRRGLILANEVMARVV